jgi:hypothetical protein
MALVPLQAQIPPSVRAAAPSTLTPEELQAECMALKETVAALQKDVVWLRQPYSAAEVRDIERLMTTLGCTITGLEGRWQITGAPNPGLSPVDPNYRESITLVLTAVAEEAGLDEAAKPYGPVRSGDFMCRRADVFYTGTMTYSSTPPWVGSSREAKVIACGNSKGQLTAVAGRFGVVEGGGVSARVGGGFILISDGPTEMHGSRILMAPGAGSYQPQADWTLKKTN